MKLKYTLHARNDLKEIYAYIAEVLHSSMAAKSTTEKIMQEARSLERLPERNPLYKDEPWHSQGVRVARVKNYLVLYTVNFETDTVTVVRIIYAGRDISKQLEDTTEW